MAPGAVVKSHDGSWARIGLSAMLVGAVMAWRILVWQTDQVPDSDELHTLTLGRWIAQELAVGPRVGLLTPYEGGSWLVAWPLALILRLGVDGEVALNWLSALFGATGAAATTWWVGSVTGDGRRGLAAGTLLLVGSPQLVYFAGKAWGSLPEALCLLAVAAVLLQTLQGRVGNRTLALITGVFVGLGIVFSYLFLPIALALSLSLLSNPSRPLRERLIAVFLLLAMAGILFLAWYLSTEEMPFLGAPPVRDGHNLVDLLAGLFPGSPSTYALDGARAWHGPLHDAPAWVAGPGAGLWLVVLIAAFKGWSAGPIHRSVTVLLAVFLLAASAASGIADDSFARQRYFLPAVCVGLVLVALSDRLLIGAAAILGLTLTLAAPTVPPTAGWDVEYLRLGSYIQPRSDLADPHGKLRGLLAHTEPWHREPLALAAGFAAGRVVASRTELLQGQPSKAGSPLQSLASWAVADLGQPTVDRAYQLGLGAGLAHDGVLTSRERALVERVWGSVLSIDRLRDGVGADAVDSARIRMLVRGEIEHGK